VTFTSSPSQVARFTHGEAIGVDVAGIERELAALWRQAAQGSTAVMRACAWNLVVLAEGDSLEKARELAERVVEQVPSRALIVHHQAKAEGAELAAFVSARCKLLPGGGKMLCTEEITLESRRSGSDFLPSLVRALLVPDIPTAVLCAGVPSESALLDELVGVAERVIFDSHGADAGSVRHLGPRAIDLAYLRIAPWQRQVAAVFDTPGWLSDLQALTVSTKDVHQSEGRWLGAWLRSRLKSPPMVRIGGEEEVRLRFKNELNETYVPAVFESEAVVLAEALRPNALTPAWFAAQHHLELTPRQATSASWNDFRWRFVSAATEAISQRGVFTCALTGGSAVKMYPQLAQEKLDWSRMEFFVSDERLVPLESPDSNYRAVREALPMARIHPVRVQLSPDEAAADYARLLPVQLDLIHLGMGPDGHVASLFEGHPMLYEERLRVVAVTDSPKPPPERVTFTLPTFAQAREVWFLITGDNKKAAAQAARTDPKSKLPAALVHRVARRALWFMDL